MENMISARRLRKSVLKDTSTNINLDDIGISDIEIRKKIRDHLKEKSIDDELHEDKKINFKYRYKLFIKFFISINILFLCLVCKLMFKDHVLNNKYAKIVIKEYKKDYTKIDVLEKIEEYAKSGYEAGKYIIPENIVNYVSSNYVIHLKPRLVNFSFKNEVINVFNNANKEKNDQNIIVEEERKTSEEISNEQISGVGGGEPYAEASLEEVISAVSTLDNDTNEILSKNINIVLPVKGTITSRYGAREQIFDNVNPYHTGIDIANSNNTKISSATDGIVIKTEKMNKYYGNNIEIEKDGVIFKYAHLNKIEVKQGETVKQGDIIGLMGSTGMSTGPHLHFEIKINNRTIDPEKILNFN